MAFSTIVMPWRQIWPPVRRKTAGAVLSLLLFWPPHHILSLTRKKSKFSARRSRKQVIWAR